MLRCADCQTGFELDTEQWNRARLVASDIKKRDHELSEQEAAEWAVELASEVFPDLAADVRGLLWEELGDRLRSIWGPSNESRRRSSAPIAPSTSRPRRGCVASAASGLRGNKGEPDDPVE
jgi:hypothetical protein